MTPLDPQRWSQCAGYWHGIELFNQAQYWEAHEAWEELWKLAGRRGPLADFLKGLIKLAAAGVKAQKGVPVGVVSHARRATELFEQVRPMTGEQYCGLNLTELTAWAQALTARPSPVPITRIGLNLEPRDQ